MNKKRKDDGIKWNRDKKLAREQEELGMREKQMLADIYERWKVDLCSKSRTRKEMIAYFYKLRDLVLDRAKECVAAGVGDFNDYTYKIIENHITFLITSQIAGHNVVKQHVPVTLVASGQVAEAKTAPFKNRTELLEVDFVKWFTEQPGFTGLSWKRVEQGLVLEFMLLAHYGTGDTWLVGTMVNDTGLDDIPEYADVAETIVIDDFVKLRETGSTAAPGKPPPTGEVT